METTTQPITAKEEIARLEDAILRGDCAIIRQTAELADLHKKQGARRMELGFQKARAAYKKETVSDSPLEGWRMVVVQTGAGISTRWIKP